MTMKYRLMGASGLRVSELCLGTMTFGGDHAGTAVDETLGRSMYAAFRDAGGNFIDTANMYSRGESEKIVGTLIGADREEIALASKYTMSMNTDDPNAGGNQRKNMTQALHASLKRLRTDYIDLYWVHANDPYTPLEETLRTLDDAVSAGKILYVGISNMPAWRVAQAQMLARQNHWVPITALQVQYSLIERSIEAEFLPMAGELGMGITAWSPLGGGVLTGKYLDEQKADEQAPRGRLESMPGYGALLLSERNQAVAELVGGIAASLNASSAQVALAWLLAKGALPIIGATTMAQLQDNLAGTEVTLSPEHLEQLDSLTTPSPTYPHTLWPRINAMQFGSAHERLDPRRLGEP